MPFQDVLLKPGVDVQKTFELNESGFSVTQLVRFKENLCQKLGGWSTLYPFPLSSTPVRAIHAWQGLLGNQYVAAGSCSALQVVSSGALLNITPQFNDTTPPISFSVTNGSCIVTVVDAGSSANIYSSVRFDTPVSIAGQVLTGTYQIQSVVDANTYRIFAKTSTASVSSGGTLPTFSSSAGSPLITVVFPSAGYQVIQGLFYNFKPATSVGGQTINGPYQIGSIVDSTSFTLVLSVSASATAGPVTMNSTLAALHYYFALGPLGAFGAYGAGAYGAGTYGVGTAPGAGGGTQLSASDWSLDNWGAQLVAIPKNGGVYIWDPSRNLFTAQIVPSAPIYNIAGFVSQPLQILFLIGSTQLSGVQDPLIANWSNQGDYTNYIVSNQTTAGSFRFPTGSVLVGAIQAPLFGVIWTDIDIWIVQYIGQPLIYSFTRVGSGCGLIGQHASAVLSGNVYWAGPTNFYVLGEGSGVSVMPCTVWDFFFQQLDKTNQSKVVCGSNSAFNEIWWFFPVIGGTGENTAYVKVHIQGQEYEWDYGMLVRTAWSDTTAIGPPMGTDQFGNLMQHETSNDGGGTPINAYIESGWFAIGDATNIQFIDWCLPDMRWSLYPGSATGTILFTFFAVDYPGDAQRTYGPFTATQATEYLNIRMRGRFFRVRVESQDAGSFWRLGKIKFRWAMSGRR